MGIIGDKFKNLFGINKKGDDVQDFLIEAYGLYLHFLHDTNHGGYIMKDYFGENDEKCADLLQRMRGIALHELQDMFISKKKMDMTCYKPEKDGDEWIFLVKLTHNYEEGRIFDYKEKWTLMVNEEEIFVTDIKHVGHEDEDESMTQWQDEKNEIFKTDMDEIMDKADRIWETKQKEREQEEKRKKKK